MRCKELSLNRLNRRCPNVTIWHQNPIHQNEHSTNFSLRTGRMWYLSHCQAAGRNQKPKQKHETAKAAGHTSTLQNCFRKTKESAVLTNNCLLATSCVLLSS